MVIREHEREAPLNSELGWHVNPLVANKCKLEQIVDT